VGGNHPEKKSPFSPPLRQIKIKALESLQAHKKSQLRVSDVLTSGSFIPVLTGWNHPEPAALPAPTPPPNLTLIHELPVCGKPFSEPNGNLHTCPAPLPASHKYRHREPAHFGSNLPACRGRLLSTRQYLTFITLLGRQHCRCAARFGTAHCYRIWARILASPHKTAR